MIKKEIKEKVGEYTKLEGEILGMLKELPNYERECNCSDREIITFTSKGEYGFEHYTYCLNCGGYVEM